MKSLRRARASGDRARAEWSRVTPHLEVGIHTQSTGFGFCVEQRSHVLSPVPCLDPLPQQMLWALQ